jgi:hypothetical protein
MKWLKRGTTDGEGEIDRKRRECKSKANDSRKTKRNGI